MNTKVTTKIDLSRYNRVELEVLLDHGIISVTEYENELLDRGINPNDTVML